MNSIKEPIAKEKENEGIIPVVEIHQGQSTEEVFDLYEKREKIYTRFVRGFFQRVRYFTGWPLLLGYFLLPWVRWDDRQAVLLDLPNREFYLFNFTFWPENFFLLALLLIIAAYGLFTITVFAGRVWCGYTCPQTVWTAIYMWMEQFAEGSRNERIRLDKAPLCFTKVRKKLFKHAMWLGFALLTATTFVSYFVEVHELYFSLATLTIDGWSLFWVFFFTAATYINAGWMREQVCIYMCPYARFQAAMFDKDTLIVAYDEKRGEARGSRKKGVNPAEQGLGDCIDCNVCVQVCPTGIDIRDGLQYECITCAMCIDACDSIMEKMNYDKGLISYTTQNKLEGKEVRFLRPRLIGYLFMLLTMIGFFMHNIMLIEPYDLEVSRDRTQLFWQKDGFIENRYQVKVHNKIQQPVLIKLGVEASDDLEFDGLSEVDLEAGESYAFDVVLKAKTEDKVARESVEFYVYDARNPKERLYKTSRFIGKIR